MSLCGEWVVRSVGNASRSLRACVGAAWVIRSAREGRVAVRGRAKGFGGEGVMRSAVVRRDCVGVHRAACGCASALRGRAPRSLRVCVGAAWGSGSARRGRVAVRGRAKVFGGEWVVRSAGLTHIRRSRSRARVLLYIRPACPRREIAAMGPKDAFCEYPSPAKAFRTRPVCVCTSAPAFTLPPHRLPRLPRSNRPPAAAVIHNGLSTEKLSTSLFAALCKTFSPSRLRTRIYNISFARRPLPGSVRAAPEKSPRRCDPVARAAERRVGEGEGKGGTHPLAVPNHAACVPNHCAQRRKCTRPTLALPVRSPRGNLSTPVPPPVDG